MESLHEISSKKIPVKWSHGRKSVEIISNLEKDGDRIEMKDTMMAAIAREQEEVILTGNPEDFERIEDVEMESY